MDELGELKKLRKKLGLTQGELARRANVSQSLVAKIESGKIDPSYTNAKKIFETLSLLNKKNELSASDIMYKKIIFVSSRETLKQAILTMRKNNISQMPVLDDSKVVGYISESVLLDKLLEGDTQTIIGDVMETSPPILPPATSQGIVANLLKHFPFVLIEDKGRLVGIITKADLLKVAYK
ncbi:CBS domain-containing protein [Candidatus Woesearchaeota archaeon]|nr:CBS domain-containing protein [Candidatus Woesearchaeota archaeon]